MVDKPVHRMPCAGNLTEGARTSGGDGATRASSARLGVQGDSLAAFHVLPSGSAPLQRKPPLDSVGPLKDIGTWGHRQ